jgi:hypothetical protein
MVENGKVRCILSVSYIVGGIVEYADGHPDLGGKPPTDVWKEHRQSRSMNGNPAKGAWIVCMYPGPREHVGWWGEVPFKIRWKATELGSCIA